MADCIIIGGGLIGLLTARELHRAGAEVMVLERGELGRESSWAGGGILSPLYPWRYDDAVTALVRWSQAHYSTLAEELLHETGVDLHHLQCGLLILDTDERDEATSWARRTGTELQLLTREQINRCEPAITDRYDEALWLPGVGQVRNPRLLQALHHSLSVRGVSVIEHAEVSGFVISEQRIQSVITARGSYAADIVIIAGGAWSGLLLSKLGMTADIMPVRGQMLLLQTRPRLLSRIVLKQGRYVIPRKDGLVLVGSTLEHAGFDKSITAQAYSELHQAATDIVSGLSHADVIQHWAGLRPGSSRGIPMIGAIPRLDGVYVNTGHFRNGIVAGYASARLLTDIITGDRPILDPSPYAM